MAHDTDSLKARFRCALCGQEHDDDLELDVRDVESGRQFRIGETIRPDVEHLSASYFVLRRPRDGEGVRLINQVGCENNPSDYAWAEMVFAGDRVVDVQGAVLDRVTLARVHAIHENVTDLFEDQLGVRIDQMMEDQRAAYILEHPRVEHPETSE